MADVMKTHPLGKTGLTVSEIGLGTWALATDIYGEIARDAQQALVDHALEAGVNFFDTAPLYGTKEMDGVAETVLGAKLGARRHDVVIATKFGRTSSNVMPGRFHAREARVSCEASLRRLQRDWIDLLFFHSPFTPDEIDDDVWAELGKLQQEGKVRALGHSVSMYDATAAMSADWLRQRRIDAVQVVLSPFNREARPLIAVAEEVGAAVIARECLANGFLSGTITADTVFPEGSLNARYSREEIGERAAYAEALAEKLVVEPIQTLPEATYRWVLDQPGVTLALSGAKRPAELADCLRASQAPAHPTACLDAVETIHRKDFGAA